ncbi:MAG: NusA-like transcription termination signal-binding factor [Lachnospiraceae bacterium]|nr:NusA-like transcription termination signal-binding factor [Lachnospiraceae bacterium]
MPDYITEALLPKDENITRDWGMRERSLGFKERRYIEELRILTHATALDCVIDDRFGRIIYVIKKGGMGIAIGKNGDNIRKLSRVLGKRIEMVEFDEEPSVFIENMFKPAEVSLVFFDEENIVRVFVKQKGNLGLAIGKNGSTIEKAKLLTARFFNRMIDGVSTEDAE